MYEHNQNIKSNVKDGKLSGSVPIQVHDTMVLSTKYRFTIFHNFLNVFGWILWKKIFSSAVFPFCLDSGSLGWEISEPVWLSNPLH